MGNPVSISNLGDIHSGTAKASIFHIRTITRSGAACNARGELLSLLITSKIRLQLNKESKTSVTGGSRCKSDAVPQP